MVPLYYTPYDKNENSFYDDIYTRFPKPIALEPRIVTPAIESVSEKQHSSPAAETKSYSEPELRVDLDSELDSTLERLPEDDNTPEEESAREPEHEHAPQPVIPIKRRYKSCVKRSDSSSVDSAEVVYKKINGCYIRCDHLDEKMFRSGVDVEDARSNGDLLSQYPNLNEPLAVSRSPSPAQSECPSDTPSLLQTIPTPLRPPSPVLRVEADDMENAGEEHNNNNTEEDHSNFRLHELSIDLHPKCPPVKAPALVSSAAAPHPAEPRSQWVVTKVTVKTKDSSEVKFDIQNERKKLLLQTGSSPKHRNRETSGKLRSTVYAFESEESSDELHILKRIESECDSSAYDDYPPKRVIPSVRSSVAMSRLGIQKLSIPTNVKSMQGKPIKAKIITHKSKLLQKCDPALLLRESQSYRAIESDYDTEEVMLVPKSIRSMKQGKLPMDVESEPEMMLADGTFEPDYDSEPAYTFGYVSHASLVEIKPKQGQKKKTVGQPPKTPKKRGRKPKPKNPTFEPKPTIINGSSTPKHIDQTRDQSMQLIITHGNSSERPHYLDSLADLGSKKGRVKNGKSKTDIDLRRETDLSLANRRHSCFVQERAPDDLVRNIISSSEVLLDYSQPENTTMAKRKRGRPKKQQPNHTQALLNTAAFKMSPAKLNQMQQPIVSDDDSELDIGNIEQQLSQLRRGSNLSALRMRKQSEIDGVYRRDTYSPQRSTTLHIEILQSSDLLQSMTSIPPREEEIIDQHILSSTSSTVQIKDTSKSYLHADNDNDSNTVSSSNTLGEGDEHLIHIQKMESNFVIDSELPDQIYDDDDIQSPAYEPVVTNSQNDLTLVEFNEPKAQKPRVILKRTRGKPRWTRQRKKTTTQSRQSDASVPAVVVSTTIDDIMLSPESVSAPHMSETVISDVLQTKKRGRKRKNSLEPPKIQIETEKRTRSSRIKWKPTDVL